jgi:dihydroorotate dehydrogenase electron transfer subunit
LPPTGEPWGKKVAVKLESALVVSQEEAYENTFLMWLSCPAVARGASPGRFLMIHCGEADDPLLARPMSFHRFRESAGDRQFAILYDVRGRGTTLLSKKRPGDRLSVFGPLGRGYALRSQTQHALLVAGGLGVAPVIALADEALAAGKSVTILHGARTSSALVPPGMLPSDVELMSATDDGSAGHHGYVTQLLERNLSWADQVFACGPNPMFAAMADVMRSLRSRKPVQALLEERMGCGTGVCYGCAVFTRKGVKLVCRDGPRFELREAFG